MAASPGDLVTIDKVKSYLDQAGGAVDMDPKIEGLITQESAEITRKVGNTRLLPVTRTSLALNGNGRDRIMLPDLPVSDVTALSIDGVDIPERTTPTGSGYVLSDPDAGELAVFGYCFTRGAQNVVVSYSAGYAAVPADIEKAVVELVALDLQRSRHIGVASENAGGATTTFVQPGVPSHIEAIIQRYAVGY